MMKKVVVIGGGTGLSTVLRGLRAYPLDITAIVTMTDDGASSGILRKLPGNLPPGDIRKCIAALSEDESGITEIFEYRFQAGRGIKGHSIGNLLITAMREKTGSFELAVEKISDILKIKGKVLPATLDDVHLEATFDNRKVVSGQVKIREYGYKHKIAELRLSKQVRTNPRALKAISEADIIFVGPGSLFTSVLPNFLQPKVASTVANAQAPTVFISNVSTELGETTGFDVLMHLDTLRGYGISPDAILINNHEFQDNSGDGYVTPVKESRAITTPIYKIYADILNVSFPLYHDSEKLAAVCYKLALDSKKIRQYASASKVYEHKN